MKTMTILGSTGSIGTQALEVAAKHNIKVKALAANSDVEKLAISLSPSMPVDIFMPVPLRSFSSSAFLSSR